MIGSGRGFKDQGLDRRFQVVVQNKQDLERNEWLMGPFSELAHAAGIQTRCMHISHAIRKSDCDRQEIEISRLGSVRFSCSGFQKQSFQNMSGFRQTRIETRAGHSTTSGTHFQQGKGPRLASRDPGAHLREPPFSIMISWPQSFDKRMFLVGN